MQFRLGRPVNRRFRLTPNQAKLKHARKRRRLSISLIVTASIRSRSRSVPINWPHEPRRGLRLLLGPKRPLPPEPNSSFSRS